MKAKFESLLNLSERIKKEFDHLPGKILAFSIQGIANEVLNEGVHFEPSLPPDIMELILYYVISSNFDKLDNFYPKNSDLIWRKFKLNVDNALLGILEESNYDLASFGITDSSEAVDFFIDHKNQLSKADLGIFEINNDLLEKLATHCPHLQCLKLELKHIGQEGLNFIGNMSSLKILHINSYTIPEADLSLVLKKLTLLTELSICNKALLMQKISYIENMTNLRALELRSQDNVSNLPLSLEKLTSLTSLKLYNKPFLAVDVSVIAKMTDLKSLCLASENIPGKNLSIVLDKLSSLTDLRLNGKACQEPEVTKAIEKMTSLTSLNLLSNKSIPEINLLATLKKLTLLKTLNLKGTTVSLENLPLAIEKMMSLRILRISNYDHNDKDKLNRLINILKKLPALKLILSSKEMIDALKPDLKSINFYKI